jgi:uncharacterized protein (TIGR02246 family)
MSDDEAQIRRVIERYAAGADLRDPESVAALFTPDGVMEVWLEPGSETSIVRSGRAEITQAIGFLDRYRYTQHVISNSRIDLFDDTAHGETHCTAHHITGSGAEGSDRTIYLRYSDDFVRIDGQWLLRRRELRAQWITTTPVEGL